MRNIKPMSTRDYVKKHNLTESDKFNHAIFVKDLKKDFNKLITNNIRRKGIISETDFNTDVKSIKDKFDAINNKTNGIISNKLFDYFFATVVIPKRNSFFKKED